MKILFMHQITCIYIIVSQQNWKHTYAQIKQKKRFVNSFSRSKVRLKD